MTRRAQMPDGTILEFPDGTDDGVIDRVAKQHVVSSAVEQAKDMANTTIGAVNSTIERGMSGPFRASPPKPQRPDDGAGMTAVRAAPRAVLPAAAGAAGFGAGAAIMAPTAPVTFGLGPLLGGLVGAGLSSYATNKAQEATLDALPTGITSPLGQDREQRELDRTRHPVASFAAEVAPGFLFGRPGLGAPRAIGAEGSGVSRILSHPVAQPVVGGGLNAAIEAGNEYSQTGSVDPRKVAIAAGVGALQTKNTRLGAAVMGGGARGAQMGAEALGSFKARMDEFLGRDPIASSYQAAGFAKPDFAPDSTWTVDDNGVIVGKDGAPVSFGQDHVKAARWAVQRKLGGEFDRAIVTASDGTQHIVLQRRAAAQPEPGTAAAPAGDVEVSGQLPSTEITPEPVAPAAPQAAAVAPPPEPVSASAVEPVEAPVPAPAVPEAPAMVQAGIEAVKPAEPATAEPKAGESNWPSDIPRNIFHGYGRENREFAYGAGLKQPIMGAARYSAFSPDDAANYGPNVEQAAGDLQNPLVIRSDEQWRDLTKKAGWEFPYPKSDADIASLRKMVEGMGHDGAVVWFDRNEPSDQWQGNWIKTLRNVFDVPQVIDFRRSWGASPQEGPLYDTEGKALGPEGGYQGQPVEGQSPAVQEELSTPIEGQARPEGAGRDLQDAGVAGDGGGRGGAARRGGDEVGPLEVVEDRSGITGPDKGAYQDKFMEASFTNRTSNHQTAIRATGIDPDKFHLLKPERQVALLSRGLENLTGIKMSIDPTMPKRKAIDQMLDAHHTLQGMAHVLGITPRALSLGGTLQLKLLKKGGFLGAYFPGKNEIMLPGRSNSFAHEWSHALDYHLMDRFPSQERGRGLSGAIRQHGADFEPKNVKDAFVHLLNTMFFDQAAEAARIMDLERKLAATKSDKVRAALQAQIDNAMSGKAQTQGTRSIFYRGAKTLDGKKSEYWTSPTEMMARAMEAYVSSMAAAQGLSTEFIGKGDANYQSMAEERFAKSFPKGEEREKIFAAIGDLMNHLGQEALLEQHGGTLPPEADLFTITDLKRRVKDLPNGNLIERQIEAIRKWARRRALEVDGRAENPKGPLQVLNDLRSMVFDSMAGQLKMLEARWHAPEIGKIHDLLIHTPGSGKHLPETYTEEVSRKNAELMNMIYSALKEAGFDATNASHLKDLRDALISENLDGIPAELLRAATKIRKVLNEEWYRNQNAGIDLGYANGVGYLKRQIDLPRVLANEPGFIEDAGKVYGLVFDREVGVDAEAITADEGKMDEFLKVAKANDFDIKPLRKLMRDIEKAIKADDEDRADELKAELASMVDDMLEGVRDAFATGKAVAWLGKMKALPAGDVAAQSADASYTKARGLPPEADKLLEKFYLQNPLEAIEQYVSQSVRRIAYATRFGAENEVLATMIESMAAHGVPHADQDMVLKIVNNATGRAKSTVPAPGQAALAFIHTYGTIRLLPRAVLASLPEPLTVAMTTGNLMDGFKALANTITGEISLNGEQRGELARAIGIYLDSAHSQVANERFGGSFADGVKFGRLTDAMFRNTGLTALTHRQQAQIVGATHAFLDRLSRDALKGDKHAVAMLQELGISDPLTWAKEFDFQSSDPSQGDKKGSRLPDLETLETAWGKEYALAQYRLSRMSIQEPNAMMRPYLANNPVGRVVYAIQAFNMAFWRNVIKRYGLWIDAAAQRDAGANSAKKKLEVAGQILGAKGGKIGASIGGFTGKMIGGSADIARSPKAVKLATMSAIPGALAIIAGMAIITLIREHLLNRERVTEWQRTGSYETNMAQLTLQRSFSMGSVDPFISAYTGLKYQRDLSNIMIGPAVGTLLMDIQKMVDPRDSNKNNTHEFNRNKAIYNALIGPSVAAGLSMAPGGPILSPLAGLGQMTATSPGAGSLAATLTAGPKGMKTDPKTGALSESQDAYKRRMQASKDRRIAREKRAELGL